MTLEEQRRDQDRVARIRAKRAGDAVLTPAQKAAKALADDERHAKRLLRMKQDQHRSLYRFHHS